MKKTALIICSLLFALCCLFAACFNPTGTREETAGGINADCNLASITINLGEGSKARIGFPNSPVAIQPADLSYELSIVKNGSGANPESIPVAADGTASKRGIVPGNYTLTLKVFYKGWDYAAGSETFDIAAGEHKDVFIQANRLATAVALDIEKGTIKEIGTVAQGAPPVPNTITIYNFTGTDLTNIMPGSSASGFSWMTSPISIAADSSATFDIAPSTGSSGLFETSLTLTYGAGSVSLPLRLNVYGGSPVGDGLSIGTAFQIRDALEMTYVGRGSANPGPYQDWTLGKWYELTADITLPAGNWTPIGTSANFFDGSFEGGGHTISGLKINTTADYQGLFAMYGDGAMQNLTLSNVDISGGMYTGALCGYYRGGGGVIFNCSVVGGTVAGSSQVGGIVGGSYHQSNIICCNTTCAVSGDSQVGGIAGFNNNNSIVESSYATGNVSGSSEIGGVVGKNEGRLYDCYATGAVSGGDYVGGIMGYNAGSVEKNVALNASIGRTGGGTNFGRVSGNAGGTLSDNYAYVYMAANGGITFTDKVAAGIGGADVSASQYNTQSFWDSPPLSWDFIYRWQMSGGANPLPILR